MNKYIDTDTLVVKKIAVNEGYIDISGTDTSTSEDTNLKLNSNNLLFTGKYGSIRIGTGNMTNPIAGGNFYYMQNILINRSATMFNESNTGININVQGAARNYGIASNAPLVASDFIRTTVRCDSFSGSSTYRWDFSQNTIYLLYVSTNTVLTLPSESSVASNFGYSETLPANFGVLLCFHVRPSSKTITFKNIYDYNALLGDQVLSEGDTMWVLCYKYSTAAMRYQNVGFTFGL